MSWAAYSDVQTRVPGRPTFSASSKPTQTEVTAWITEGEGEISAHLLAGGTDPAGADANGLIVLKRWSTDYAVGRYRQGLANAAGDGDNDDGEDLITAHNDRLADMLKEPSKYGSLLLGGIGAASDNSRRLRSHVLDNDDSLTVANGDFAPRFTRKPGEFKF